MDEPGELTPVLLPLGALLLALLVWGYRATARYTARQYDRLRNAEWLATL